MILLTASHISKAYGVTVILEDVSLVVHKGQRIGIIGSNGSGKTTFAEIIAGILPHDSGSIALPRETKVGYMQQFTQTLTGGTVWDMLLEVYAPMLALEKRMRSLEEEMALHHTDEQRYEKLITQYDAVSYEFEQADGYAYESKMQGVLTGLGFTPAQYTQEVDTLSGGQQTRLLLAMKLLQRPDLLILDEPTNHLDIQATQWLQDYLRTYDGTILLISHDRYLLDAVCDGILEISNKKSVQYEGNYTRSMQKRTAQYNQQLKEYLTQQEELERQRSIIERYRAYNSIKSNRRAQSREKLLDKVERIEKPTGEGDAIHFAFEAARPTGQDVLTIANLSKRYDALEVFSGFNLHVRAGERVALIGPNGIGKTTLLDILMHKTPQNAGTVRYGANVQLGYYDQQFDALHPEKLVIDELWDDYNTLTQTQVRNALAAFLFRGEDVFKPVGNLSGGEKGKLMLVKLMMRRDNVLLLDEPTNHLDMPSREVLESSLEGFEGTMLFVSHDRYFINRIANRIVEMRAGGYDEYIGNYDDYLEQKRKLEQSPQEELATNKTAQLKQKRKDRQEREDMRQKREAIQAAEQQIAAAEQEIAQLEQLLSSPQLYEDGQKAAEAAQQYTAAKRKLEALVENWILMNEG